LTGDWPTLVVSLSKTFCVVCIRETLVHFQKLIKTSVPCKPVTDSPCIYILCLSYVMHNNICKPHWSLTFSILAPNTYYKGTINALRYWLETEICFKQILIYFSVDYRVNQQLVIWILNCYLIYIKIKKKNLLNKLKVKKNVFHLKKRSL